MGGPPILFFHGLYLWTLGSWTSAVLHLLLTLFLSMHPLPKADGWLRQTRFALALYKYFSYRFVWSDDHRTEAQQCGAWMGAGPPHGVLPLANVRERTKSLYLSVSYTHLTLPTILLV